MLGIDVVGAAINLALVPLAAREAADSVRAAGR